MQRNGMTERANVAKTAPMISSNNNLLAADDGNNTSDFTDSNLADASQANVLSQQPIRASTAATGPAPNFNTVFLFAHLLDRISDFVVNPKVCDSCKCKKRSAKGSASWWPW